VIFRSENDVIMQAQMCGWHIRIGLRRPCQGLAVFYVPSSVVMHHGLISPSGYFSRDAPLWLGYPEMRASPLQRITNHFLPLTPGVSLPALVTAADVELGAASVSV